MHPARRPLLPDELERFRAATALCRVWLCEVMLWIAELFGDGRIGRAIRAELREDLRLATRGLRAMLFLIAYTHAHRPHYSRFTPHILKSPRGFARCGRRGSLIRHLTRPIRFRGRTLRGHFGRLRDVIDNLDAYALKIAPRLSQKLRQRAPIAVRPPAMIAASVAGVAPTIADSS